MKKLREQRSDEGETNSMFGCTVSSDWIHKEFMINLKEKIVREVNKKSDEESELN